MKVRILIPVVACVLFSSLFASSAVAQDPPAAAADGVRTFFPADFAQFAPRTALDMLTRVPGFSIRQGGQERGLGQASINVLINGQRISGKSNDVVTELSRIPAQNVERIEIVDGATLDVPGLSGQVANVIVISREISGQFGYRPEFREYNTDPLFTRFEVSVGGTRGPVEYTIGLSNPSSRSGASGPTWIYSPDGALIENRDDHWKGNAEQPRLSARLVFDGPGSAVGNLNLLYGRLYFDFIETGIRSRPGQPDRERVVTVDKTGGNYEIGGDYELELGRGHLKLIGVTRGWVDNDSDVNVVTTFADGSPMTASRFTRSGDEGEMIGRSEYRWKDLGGAEWQISAEGAFNSLDNVSRLFILDSEGEYEEIPLPGGSARVEEDRYEVMGTYGRSLNPYVGMKLSIGGEYSELSQVGNAGGTRNFFRPKGEISAAWQPSAGTDVNFKLARRVGQLNFYDFLASVNLSDDQAKAANPDLVPQQSWDLDLEGVRELGPHGTTTLRLYGRLIDDIIDFVPIGATGESPGNLDQATVYGIESQSTFLLDAIGFAGGRLDLHAQWQDTEVEDPLTGERRPISNSLQERSRLALRHDIPGSDWAWGGGVAYQRNARYYRLTEVGRMWEGPVWGDLYLEHKDVYGVTIRGGVYNLFDADSMWDRTVYVERRTGPVDFVEERNRLIGPIFSFSIRGKF